jgi:hypothetical protein
MASPLNHIEAFFRPEAGCEVFPEKRNWSSKRGGARSPFYFFVIF